MDACLGNGGPWAIYQGSKPVGGPLVISQPLVLSARDGHDCDSAAATPPAPHAPRPTAPHADVTTAALASASGAMSQQHAADQAYRAPRNSRTAAQLAAVSAFRTTSQQRQPPPPQLLQPGGGPDRDQRKRDRRTPH